jgi:hypothetical protein
MSKELTEFDSDPYSLFIFAINSPSTKEKSVPRLNKFFEFINLSGTMQEKCSIFAKGAIDQPSWAVVSVIRYLQMNKERVEKKEIFTGFEKYFHITLLLSSYDIKCIID